MRASLNPCLLWLALPLAFPLQSRSAAADQSSALAENGGVQISSIEVVKRAGEARAKERDPAGTQLNLWLTRKTEGASGFYVVSFAQLDPIEDDTGRILSSQARLEAMRFLKNDFKTTRHKSIDDRSGPTVSMVLDPPAKGATKIRLLKGKAVVLTCARLKFDDLTAVTRGKPLEHAELKDFSIKPSVKFADGQTTVALEVPLDHARIAEWGLGERSSLLNPTTESISKESDCAILTKVYQGDHTKGSFLGIMVARPDETLTYDFEFKDIELP
jgi:hypothetical protein